MQNIFFRKYSSTVIIGLGVATLASLGVIVWMWMKYSSSNEKLHAPIETKQPEISETHVSSGTPSLVFLYSIDCGHCHAMMDAWKNVEETLKTTGQIEALAIEMADIPTQIKLDGSIKGFPDIRFYPQGFPEGKFEIYNGDRSEESLLKFAYSNGSV